MSNQWTMAEIVNKMIGPIEPVGSTHVDEKRLENLEATLLLLQQLEVTVWNMIYNNVRACEASRKAAVSLALKNLRNNVEDTLNMLDKYEQIFKKQEDEDDRRVGSGENGRFLGGPCAK
jgi:hypothetical protein